MPVERVFLRFQTASKFHLDALNDKHYKVSTNSLRIRSLSVLVELIMIELSTNLSISRILSEACSLLDDI